MEYLFDLINQPDISFNALSEICTQFFYKVDPDVMSFSLSPMVGNVRQITEKYSLGNDKKQQCKGFYGP
jgi:hypothetical protein